MGAFKKMYDAGKLAIVNGCGYPQPSRSHFRSMEIWQTANPMESEPCGWLGHYLDHAIRGTAVDNPLRAVNIGSELPQALVAEGPPVPSIGSIEDFRIKYDQSSEYDVKAADKILRSFECCPRSKPGLAVSLPAGDQRHRRRRSDAQFEGVQSRCELSQQRPGTAAANHRAVDCREFSAPNFSIARPAGSTTHANQVNGHERTLAGVADSISAFMTDLTAKGVADKVTVMCFSEFGRRVTENNSNGTDHGAAGPMFHHRREGEGRAVRGVSIADRNSTAAI